jgi:acetyl-CoA carboxylase biotin carboxyl carrier protein
MAASKGESGSGEAFDLRRIKRLVELMQEHGLSEVDLRQGDMRIRLSRGALDASLTPAPLSGPVPHGPGATGAHDSPAQQAARAAQPTEPGLLAIKSPMVGTLYLASSPDAEPYVHVGSPVEPDTTVCIIEAMKVFNEIPADCSGRIIAILVDNEQPVDVDKPLFKVDTSK